MGSSSSRPTALLAAGEAKPEPPKPTALTRHEQYSYMSMWALMAAPLTAIGDRTFGSLRRHRNYRLYFAGSGISFIGTWIFIILTWLNVNTIIASTIGAAIIFILRLLAIRFKVTLPAP